jgi:hypothetical protein
MRPLDLSLRIFGLSHFAQTSGVKPTTEKIAYEDKQTSRRQLIPKIVRVYCIFICCLLILNVLRYIPSFWVGYDFVPNLTALRIVFLLWYIENAISAIVLFVFFDKKEHFEWYKEQYNRVISDSISKHLKVNPGCNKLRKCMIRNLVVGWIVISINTVLIILLNVIDISPIIPVLLCNPLPYNSVMVKILGCLIHFLSSGVWVLPVVLHYSLTSALQFRFEELYRVMENTELDQCDNRFEILKNVRQKHLQLCKMVETVDQSLSFYIGNIFTISMGISCFMLYVVINDINFTTQTSEAVIIIFWLASSFLQLFLISNNSATLNEKVGSHQTHNVETTWNQR